MLSTRTLYAGLFATFLLAPTSARADEKPFRLSVNINKPVERVWQALTSKQDVDRYYLAPLGADITRPGQAIYYGRGEKKLITGVVSAFSRPRTLSHTFTFAGGSDKHGSSVTYRLKAEGQSTLLTIEHKGYPAKSRAYANVAMGWPIIFDRLKAHLAGKTR